MRTVYKYELKFEDIQTINMPAGAQAFSFQNQYEKPVLYAVVDTDNPPKLRTFRLAGTGHDIDAYHDGNLEPIGTAMFQGGALVMHLFEVT
jgi:hypothetical protein